MQSLIVVRRLAPLGLVVLAVAGGFWVWVAPGMLVPVFMGWVIALAGWLQARRGWRAETCAMDTPKDEVFGAIDL